MAGEQILATTTDSQADLDRAAGIEPSPAQDHDGQPEREEAPPGPEQDQGQQEGQENAQEAQAEPGRPTKSAVQRRIDRLTRERAERDRTIQGLQGRLEKLERESSERRAPKESLTELAARLERETGGSRRQPDQPPLTPDRDAVETARQNREQQAAAEERDRALLRSYQERTLAALKREGITKEQLEKAVIPNLMIPALVEMDNGDEVAVYLAQNPEECQRLMKLSPAAGVAYLGRISAQLDGSLAAARRPVSTAPAPIRPVGGSGTRSSIPLDELPYRDFARIREQQEKQRYRR